MSKIGPVATPNTDTPVKTCATMAPVEEKPKRGKQLVPVPVGDDERCTRVPERTFGWIQKAIEKAWLLKPSEVKPDA